MTQEERFNNEQSKRQSPPVGVTSRAATGDRRTATGDRRTATGGHTPDRHSEAASRTAGD